MVSVRRVPAAIDARRRFLRVVWTTNLAAPYRRPVWQALSARVHLKVFLLEGRISADKRANRAADWDRTEQSGDYAVGVLRTLRIRSGEEVYYISADAPRMSNVDVVVLGGWESPAYWQLALVARLTGARLVGFYESHAGSTSFARGPIALFRRWWFRMLDAVVVPGEASARAVRAMGVRSTRVFTGFNAVDVVGLAEASSRHRSPGRGHRYLYVGQLIERKNVATLLEAFHDQRLADDQLTIVGIGPDEAALRGLAENLDLAGSVSFMGYVPQAELGAVLGHADTLVLPSLQEVWGLVVNEALASGLHVVVSAAAGVADSVKEMPGVWVTDTDRHSIGRALSESRNAYRGPIRNPPILEKTPERFANVFISAFRFALAHPNSRSERRRGVADHS